MFDLVDIHCHTLFGVDDGATDEATMKSMLDAAYTQQWWGGTFILNGDNEKCTKIALE